MPNYGWLAPSCIKNLVYVSGIVIYKSELNISNWELNISNWAVITTDQPVLK